MPKVIKNKKVTKIILKVVYLLNVSMTVVRRNINIKVYNLDKISTAVGVVIASYIAQFFTIGLLVFILIKLAY